MFTHILVPLDGSELAERAVHPALQIAKATSAKLTLLRVVPQFTILAADPMLYEEMNRLGEDESLSYVRSVAQNLHPYVVNSAIESGPPADTIVHFAAEENVDLIVMSSHGRSGINRWIYGSVAERVLRGAPCATMVINSRVENPFGEHLRLLVPLDGSELAEKALLPATSMAKMMGASLNLLIVIPEDHESMETITMRQVFDDIEQKEMVEAETYLKSKQETLSLDPLNYSVKVTSGSVAETIINYVVEEKIDLIIMSSHGRTGIWRWVYGSVAEKILRSACCATMIIRSQEEVSGI